MYVDELPKSCWECPCFKNNLEFPCGLSDGTQDYFKDEIDGENCPLKSIKTHDRELVKEVCEKIREKIVYYPISVLDEAGKVKANTWGISKKDIENLINQMQKEYEK